MKKTVKVMGMIIVITSMLMFGSMCYEYRRSCRYGYLRNVPGPEGDAERMRYNIPLYLLDKLEMRHRTWKATQLEVWLYKTIREVARLMV